MSRLLFALQDAGAGHRRVATALADRLHELRATEPLAIIDLPAAVGTPLLRRAPGLYNRVSTARLPLLAFDLAFTLTNTRRSCAALAGPAARLRREKLTELVEKHQPDLAVVTHPLFISDMLAAGRARASMAFPIVTVVADPVNPHASWATSGADRLFATTKEAVARLRQFGRSDVTLVSFPVEPAFTAPWRAPEDARLMLGLNVDSFTILVMSGGCGAGRVSDNVRCIVRHRPEAQLVILCGRNEKLRHSLKSAPWLTPAAHVLGFVSNPCDYMDAADIIVSKAGPSTIFEAAHRHRPLVITEERGRQERGNGALVIRNHWGTAVRGPAELGQTIAVATKVRQRRSRPHPADPGDGGAALVRTLIEFLS